MWRLVRPDAARALEDRGVRRGLPRYVEVVRDRRRAKFLIAKALPADFHPDDSTGDLWRLHGSLLEEYRGLEAEVDAGEVELEEFSPNFLDLKAELARRIMAECHFCIRRCGVNRLRGERGYCRVGDDFQVSSWFHHLGEEPELVPSGTVFTLGCTIRCIHCQNWSISQWYESGTSMTPFEMSKIVEGLRRGGCRNLNMVGGEPTPYCWLWIETMRLVDVNIPTVWNSNSYYSPETAELLAGFIDVYLLDFKYGNNRCAEEISDAPGYWEACTRNHLMAERYGELIIRVLVLPEHNECCTRPILEWIARHLRPWTRVNVMFQYRPEWRAHQRREMSRRLRRDEMEEALRIAREVGIRNLVWD